MMNSRSVSSNTRLRRREQQQQQLNGVNGTGQASIVVPEFVLSGPPPHTPTMIDLDAIEDDDLIESTASAFAQAKSKSNGARRGPLVVDVESGNTTRLSKLRARTRSDGDNDDCDERSKSRKSKAVAPPEEEKPKFNCPICLCPFTEETTTKCGHIFCNGCIKSAITRQAKCPTCRKNVKAKDLIRVFLPTTSV